MPKFEVSLSREITAHLLITVEAADREAAKVKAIEEAESGEHDWRSQYSEIDVFSVTEKPPVG
jgi:hypothetical protein